MAFSRPTPKALSAETSELITRASAVATTSQKRQTSYDPEHYPVFEIPVNSRVLVYIPNHQVMTPEGQVEMRMDKFNAHPVRDGKIYEHVRCINSIVASELGFDGTCPLCQGMSEVWDLYNKEYADIAASKGLTKDAPEAKELLKQDRMDLLNEQVIKAPEMFYTFPIVVIECEEKDGVMTVNPKLTDGKLHGTPMWYTIREKTFLDKWVAGYDSIDGDIPNSPAGLWAVLNYTYQPKNGKADKMGSAKSLKVTFKSMDGYQQWAEYYDKLTEDWTPAKAQEVVVKDVLRSMEETREVADTILKPVRDKLSLYRIGSAPTAAIGTTNAEQALADFGVATPSAPVAPSAPTPVAPATPVAPSTPVAPAMPPMGDVPGNIGV